MSFRDRLAKRTGLPATEVPSSYQILGDIMLLKLLATPANDKKAVAEAILALFPRIKTVCEITGVVNEFRTPDIRILAGNGTVTTHTEHGIRYRLDAATIMFSKGNHAERVRLLGQLRQNETVVDMFAGIGYFSLGIAPRVRQVYAIEKNPVAFGYLQENIALNHFPNTEALLGDNRVLATKLEGIADRVVMGYFPGTEKFLPTALTLLKKRGMLHFHNTYRKHELWEKPLEHVASMGVPFTVLAKKKVKSVAPNVYHVVLDVEVRQ